MRRSLAVIGSAFALAAMLAVPAAADPGAGALNASFNAGLSGGEAIFVNNGQASMHSVVNPFTEGRLSPFSDHEICDQQLVGTWFYGFGEDNTTDEIYQVDSYTLDGVEIDVKSTPAKRIAGDVFWWAAFGDPVLGVLDPGTHEIQLVVTIFGDTLTFTSTVDVDASHC